MNEIENIEQVTEIESSELLDEMTDEEMAALVEKPVQVELTLDLIVDQIMDALKLTKYTMYGVAKALNLTLEAINAQKDGADYRVRPQMVYNYARNGMVVKGSKSTDEIEPTQARAFIIKFATKFVK